MESFGLFNFLKSAFFPTAAEGEKFPDEGERKVPSADGRNTPEGNFCPGEGKSEPPQILPPKEAPSSGAEEKSNPFLALMERHERAVKNIGRKTPKR